MPRAASGGSPGGGAESEGALGFLEEELADLNARRLLRSSEVPAAGATLLCSNDYLGLGAEPLPASSSGAASGATASPLVVGYRAEHREAEAALAAWIGAPSALLFSSGYAANVGAISSLVARGDLVVSDALNHASIIDGCRLSGARILVVPHLSGDAVASALQENRGFRRRLVVTEAYFSMDADGPDLRELRAVCDEERAILMVDEAHSLGIDGPEGRGRLVSAGVAADVTVGTLGKSLGLHGAFVLGSQALRSYFWNRARSLVFSTGISPAVAGAVPSRVHRVRGDDAGRSRLQRLSLEIRKGLREAGWDVRGAGPIVPIVVGSPERALLLSCRLREAGIVVQAIRPPTVPEGTARLRLTLSAGTAESTIERVLATLGRSD